MKNKIYAIIIFILLIVISIYFTFFNSRPKQPTLGTKSSSTEQISTIPRNNQPTLFIHGYNGGKGSFGGMIKRFVSDDWGTDNLVVTIDKNGEISYSGKYDATDNHPLIQVMFLDNKNTEDQQAEWINSMLADLKKQYSIEEYNVVAHSMGGLAFINYLANPKKSAKQPAPINFVAIGSPFNGLEIGDNGRTDYDLKEDGPSKETDRFKYLKKHKENYPSNLNVLNIIGDIGDGTKSDGSVSVASASSLKFLLNEQVTSIQEEIIKGSEADHSLLHENEEVDKMITNFLWDHK